MIIKFNQEKLVQALDNASKEDVSCLGISAYLQPDRLYVVQAVYNRLWAGKARPGFVLKYDKVDSYPLEYDSQLFEVVDPRLSRWWVHHSEKADDSSRKDPRVNSWLAIPEWEGSFFENLVDGEPDAVEIFSRYEQRMEWEWPRPDVSLVAEALEDCWVMCPECTESWEVDPQLALTQCPGCEMLMGNPYWVDPSAF